MFSLWKNSSPKIKRIIVIMAFFFISLIVIVAGTLTPLTDEEAVEISKELEDMRDAVLNAGAFSGTTLIFGNNFLLCLLFFIPIIGPFLGCYVLYNTGVVIAADSISASIHPMLSLLVLFVFPFTWLEFLAYSTALSQSVWLTWRIIQRMWKREMVNTCIMISICAVMLLVAAVIEMALIQAISVVV